MLSHVNLTVAILKYRYHSIISKLSKYTVLTVLQYTLMYHADLPQIGSVCLELVSPWISPT